MKGKLVRTGNGSFSRRLLAIGLAALLLVGTAACGGDDDEATDQSDPASSAPEDDRAADDPLAPKPLDERKTIRVAWTPAEVWSHLLLADLKGEFEKENLDVQFEVIPSAEQALLLDRGEIDVSASTLNAGIYNLIAGGANIKAVMSGSVAPPEAQEGFWARNEVVGDDGFQVEDLVGVPFTTAYGAGSATFGYLVRAADEMDEGVLTPETMEFNLLGLSDGVTSLINGGVQIAQAVQPLTSSIAESGCCTYLEGLWPDYPTVAIYFGPNLLDDDREAGEAFVRAVGRTVDNYLQDDYRDDPELSSEIAEAIDIPQDVFDGQVTPDWSQWGLHPDFFTDSQDYFFEVQDFVEDEVLSYDEKLELEDVYDFGFLEAVGEA